MQFIIQAMTGLLVAFGLVILAIWFIIAINDSTCNATPEIGVWGANIIKALALCWVG